MKFLTATIFLSVLCVSCGIFSPDDDGFGGYKEVKEAELFVIDLDGKNVRKLMDGQGPVLFPHSNSLIARYDGTLYSINLDGSNKKRRATVDGLGFLEFVPMSISSDEKYLAYGMDIYRLDLFSGVREKIYEGYIGESYSFSKDFKKVVTGSDSLRIIDLETGQIISTFRPDKGFMGRPLFSQNDSSVVFFTTFYQEYFE